MDPTKPPGPLDSFLAKRAAHRAAVQAPPQMAGGKLKLPRVARTAYSDHPLIVAMRDLLEHPPTRGGAKPRHYSSRTIDDYLGVARLGIAAGDLLIPIRAARTAGRHGNVHKAYLIIDELVRLFREDSPSVDPDTVFGIRVSDLLKRAEEVDAPTTKTVPTPKMNTDEWEAFVRATGRLESPYSEAILLLFTGGLRINDWFKMSRQVIKDAALGKQVVIQQKGDRSRSWFAPKALQPQLAILAGKGTWQVIRDLFTRPQPGEDDRTVYNHAYAKVRSIVDSLARLMSTNSYSPHKFRHLYAVRTRAGSNLDTVQGLLGHDSITTTKTYVPTAPQDELQAAANRTVPMELIESIPRRGKSKP